MIMPEPAASEQNKEQQELAELFQRRYNQEHQRGLSLELSGQRAENRVTQLEAEIAQLKVKITELESREIELPQLKSAQKEK